MEDICLSRSGREKEDPSPDEIEEAVRAVGSGEDFVILEGAADGFLQYDGQVLEYREGGRMFRAEVDARIAATFRAYAEGGDAWKDHWTWRDVTDDVFEDAARSRKLSVIFLAVTIAAGAALLAGLALLAARVL